MKNIFFLLLSVLSIKLFAVDVVSLNSEIDNVKIYRQNAEITRKANSKLFAGTQEIVLTDISTQIDPSSLQVKIASQGNVTLLSAKYERNYLLPKRNNPEIEKLKATLENLNDDLSWNADQYTIYNGMIDVLNKNKDLGGNDAGFLASQVADLVNVYKTKYFEIKKELIAIRKEKKTLNDEKTKIQNQLNELNAKFNKPSGNIVLLVSSVSPTTANFKCSYIVGNVGWSPIYDLRSESVSKDVQLNYKANVYQNTGQDWKNANIVVSTGNPAKNNNRPILSPLYANIFTATYNDNLYGSVNNKKEYKASNLMNIAIEEVLVEEDKYSEGFLYNAQVNKNQLSVEFEIEHKQNISSDGKLHIIPLESYTLKTEYVYHTVPKLEQAAFLIAKVSDWGKYNLISGNANIFFEGAYVGKSFLNAEITSDTMLLSMGRDENIIVQRKSKEFTEKSFFGTNKIETFGYDIIIKNKKPIAIDIEILDQVPVSQNKAITIELEEKGTADYLKKVGKLLWTVNIPAGQTKKVFFKYSAKYPSGETISGLK